MLSFRDEAFIEVLTSTADQENCGSDDLVMSPEASKCGNSWKVTFCVFISVPEFDCFSRTLVHVFLHFDSAIRPHSLTGCGDSTDSDLQY